MLKLDDVVDAMGCDGHCRGEFVHVACFVPGVAIELVKAKHDVIFISTRHAAQTKNRGGEQNMTGKGYGQQLVVFFLCQGETREKQRRYGRYAQAKSAEVEFHRLFGLWFKDEALIMNVVFQCAT